MNSRDIEARAQKIMDDIASLHEDLIQNDEPDTAHLYIPGLEVNVVPNRNDLTISIKIGRSENA